MKATKQKPSASRVTPGVDPLPVPARPSPMTAIVVLAALLVAFMAQFALARSARAEIPSLETQSRSIQAERQTLEARLAELSDVTRDARIVSLLDGGRSLDVLLPYTDVDRQPPIEAFEVDLPNTMAGFGLDVSDIRRGVVQASPTGNGSVMSVRLTARGPREGLFEWVDSLRGHDRLVTAERIQVSINNDNPTQVSAEVTLLLWFSTEQTIAEREAEIAGDMGIDVPAEEPAAAELVEAPAAEPGPDVDGPAPADVPGESPADSGQFDDLDA